MQNKLNSITIYIIRLKFIYIFIKKSNINV